MKTTEAVEAVRTLARQHAGLVLVIETLERIGSIENAEHEAAVRLEAARKAEAEQNAALAEATAKVDAARAESLTLLDNAHRDARDLTEKARDEFKRLVSEATVEAEAITKAAIERRDQGARDAEAAHARLLTIEASIEEAKAMLEKINKQKEAALAALQPAA
jgi:hypothetical protein